MLVLRNEQIEALRESMRDAFAARVAADLRRQYSDKLRETSDPELRRLVRDAMEQSKLYGVASEADVRRYVEYAVEFGSDFDQSAWARPVLIGTGTGTEKMDELDAYATFELRA